jgi:hypothetical protein
MKKIISKIAKEVLNLETLEVRYSDSLDFHDLSVQAIKKALEKAYKAGVKNSEISRKRNITLRKRKITLDYLSKT